MTTEQRIRYSSLYIYTKNPGPCLNSSPKKSIKNGIFFKPKRSLDAHHPIHRENSMQKCSSWGNMIYTKNKDCKKTRNQHNGRKRRKATNFLNKNTWGNSTRPTKPTCIETMKRYTYLFGNNASIGVRLTTLRSETSDSIRIKPSGERNAGDDRHTEQRQPPRRHEPNHQPSQERRQVVYEVPHLQSHQL